jgi:predicted metal-binding protein
MSTHKKQKQRITLFICRSIAKQAKAQAVVEELSLTGLVEKALLNYLPKETVIRKDEFRIEAAP